MTMRKFLGNSGSLTFLLAAAMAFSTIATASAQDTKKQKKGKQDTSENPMPMPPVPTPEQLDNNIGEMLGAWQVGDVEAMHKFYEDDATFTSGAFEPPLVGWQNYVNAYQKARARFQGMQLIRKNTVIYIRADFAWASYQWELIATVDGAPFNARGQTTLLFAKSGDKWLIVHNHTSQVCEANSAAPASSPVSPAPTKP
jgi:ketosteroid isomerase-like protein